MPHCDRFLYELVCKLKLDEPNSQVIVIGNSLREYKERCNLIN
jgi:hypothetical protein